MNYVLPVAAVLGAGLALAASAVRSESLLQRFDVQEVAPGVFFHAGDIALMTRANAGAMVNLIYFNGLSGAVPPGQILAVRQRTL